MTEPAVYTRQEVAEMLRVSVDTVHDMVRDGRLSPVPGMKKRITAASLHALLGGYDGRRAKPNGQTPPKEASPRRGVGLQTHGPMEKSTVGGDSSLHKSIGPAPGDVVVRLVETRGR